MGPSNGNTPEFGMQVQLAGLRQDLLVMQQKNQALVTEYQKMVTLLAAAIEDVGNGVLEVTRDTLNRLSGKPLPIYLKQNNETGIMEVALTQDFVRQTVGESFPVQGTPVELPVAEVEKKPRERVVFRDGEPVKDA